MAVLRVPQVDTDAIRDVVRDLSRDLDRSHLTALRDELRGFDLPSVDDLRHDLQRLERDLPDLGKRFGRPARRAAFALPVITPTVVLGAAALLAGATLGSVLAWLYQPGVGVKRRKAVRRRLHKLQRSIQHSR